MSPCTEICWEIPKSPLKVDQSLTMHVVGAAVGWEQEENMNLVKGPPSV